MDHDARQKLREKLREKRAARAGGGGGTSGNLQGALLRAAGDDPRALQACQAVLKNPKSVMDAVYMTSQPQTGGVPAPSSSSASVEEVEDEEEDLPPVFLEAARSKKK